MSNRELTVTMKETYCAPCSGWTCGKQPVDHRLLAEIRRRAVRATHVASSTGVAFDRGLVDDVVLAAWMVLRRHSDQQPVLRAWVERMSRSTELCSQCTERISSPGASAPS